MEGMIAGICVSLFLAGAGAAVRFGKAAWLIAGYNTASKERKAGYDLEKLCKYVGNLMFLLSGIFALITLAGALFPAHLGTIGSIGAVVFIVTALAGVIFLNTGRRVMKKPKDD